MEFTLITISVSINTFLTLIFSRHTFLVSNVGYNFSFRDDKKISDYRQTDKRQQDYLYTDVRIEIRTSSLTTYNVRIMHSIKHNVPFL